MKKFDGNTWTVVGIENQFYGEWFDLAFDSNNALYMVHKYDNDNRITVRRASDN